MATRGTPLSPHQVEALNVIDLEFSEKNTEDKAVADAWKVYLHHLHSAPNDYRDPNYQNQLQIWTEKSRDYLVDLLYAMSQALGYNFDKVRLKKASYTPKGYGELAEGSSLYRLLPKL